MNYLEINSHFLVCWFKNVASNIKLTENLETSEIIMYLLLPEDT